MQSRIKTYLIIALSIVSYVNDLAYSQCSTPSINGIGPDITFACDEIPVFSHPTTDGDDQPIQLTIADEVTNYHCGGYAVTRTWTATNACGNSVSISQVAQSIDITPPIIIGVAANGNYFCGTTPEFSTPVAWDECSNPHLVYEDELSTGICDDIITRTWIATDECGNSTSQQQVFVPIADEDPSGNCELELSEITVGDCDSSTGTYPLTIKISYENSPGGEIAILGVTDGILIDTIHGEKMVTYFYDGFPANGQKDIPLYACFFDLPECLDLGSWDAPELCSDPSPECEIKIDSIQIGDCDPATNTFDISVFVSYDETSKDNIGFMGIGNGSYTSSELFTNSGIFYFDGFYASGQKNISITAFNTLIPSCNDMGFFDAAASCESSNNCYIEIVGLQTSVCDPSSNTYNLDIVVNYLPGANTNILFSGTGSGTFVSSNLSTGSGTFSYSGLISDGAKNIAIGSFFEDNVSCVDTSYYDAPEACKDTSCYLEILNVVRSECNSLDNTYSLAVTLNYSEGLAGLITFAGTGSGTFIGSNLATGSGTFVFGGLPSNGLDSIPIAAFNIENSACADSSYYSAPIACQDTSCYLEIVNVVRSECNPTDNTYELAVTLNYSDGLASLISFAGTGSGTFISSNLTTGSGTFTFSGLPSNGLDSIPITAFNMENSDCADHAYYSAPEGCTVIDSCDLQIVSINTGACDPLTGQYNLAVTLNYDENIIDPNIFIAGTGSGSFLYSNLESGSGTFVFSGLIADGNSKLLEISSDDNCFEEASYQSPVSCLSNLYDLALVKQLSQGQSYTVDPGDDVRFTMTAINQGERAVDNILISDYIPLGFNISNSGNEHWSVDSLGNATSILSVDNGQLTAGGLLSGDSVSIEIILEVNKHVPQAMLITNTAEISSMSSIMGVLVLDSDSQMDSDIDNDVFGGDDIVDGTNEDEDDHDQASVLVNYFDLALTKNLSAGQSDIVNPGDTVQYTIRIYNQGMIDADEIVVVDYIPNGMVLVDNTWSNNNASVTYALSVAKGNLPPGGLLAGTSVALDIKLRVSQTLVGGVSLENFAEITFATDIDGYNLADVDSAFDQISDNDIYGGNDLIDNQNEDEDDHDGELITVATDKAFDLSFTKSIVSDGPYYPGSLIEYDLTVTNEGDLTADKIVINDYVDDGFTVVNGINNGWYATTGSGTTTMSYEINGSVAPGESQTVKIFLELNDNTANNSICNYGEIRNAYDEYGFAFSDVDSQADSNNTNDSDLEDDYDGLCIDVEEYTGTAGIGNYVWHDLNANGIQDAGEPGLSGVNVNLYNSNGYIVGQTQTNASGQYLFVDLIPGDYYIAFEVPSGFILSDSNEGNNNNLDSDVDESNGPNTTAMTNLDLGELDLSWDAGFYQCVPVGDRVWIDQNDNNVFDSFENGLNGVKVILYQVKNGVSEIIDAQYTTAQADTTNVFGHYKFCVKPGEYYIKYQIFNNTVYSQVDPFVGDEAFDSNMDGSNGGFTTANFTVLSGDHRCDIDAGFNDVSDDLSNQELSADKVGDIVEEIEEEKSIEEIIDANVFPNPAVNFANLEIDIEINAEVSVALLSGEGVVIDPNVFDQYVEAGQLINKKVDVSDLRSGVYVFKIMVNHHVMNKKLIVIKR